MISKHFGHWSGKPRARERRSFWEHLRSRLGTTCAIPQLCVLHAVHQDLSVVVTGNRNRGVRALSRVLLLRLLSRRLNNVLHRVDDQRAFPSKPSSPVHRSQHRHHSIQDPFWHGFYHGWVRLVPKFLRQLRIERRCGGMHGSMERGWMRYRS